MEFVNGKDDIPYMKWENNPNVWNHQPVIYDNIYVYVHVREYVVPDVTLMFIFQFPVFSLAD